MSSILVAGAGGFIGGHLVKRLINEGNTVIVIEHNLDVVKQADDIIDLGPLGGENGGKILFQGTPENIIKNQKSFTGKYLMRYIKKHNV